MRLETDQAEHITLSEIDKRLKLVTKSGEYIVIKAKDSGFEFYYQGSHYFTKKGEIHKLGKLEK